MQIIGHQKIITHLDKSIESGKVGHAYLFSGPESVGKFALAKEFAKKLLNNKLELNSDYILIEPEVEEEKGKKRVKDISIEAVREMSHRLGMTALGAYKIAIINDAHRMTASSQNSLLKILEEPARGVVIILVTHDKNKLLPTVLSRLEEKKFGALPPEELGSILEGDMAHKNEIIFWSLGRPGIAKKLLENSDELRRRIDASEMLRQIMTRDAYENFELAEKMSKDSAELQETLDFWLVYLRQYLLGIKTEINISQKRALILIARIMKSSEVLKDTNANARLVVENLLIA